LKLLPLLLAFLLPACGSGTDNVAPPPLMDLGKIVRPATPNTALAAPAGFEPKPDVATPVFQVSAARLYAAIRDVAAHQPRIFPSAAFDGQFQAHYVARSALFGFPDLVTVQAMPAGDDAATLIIWSRSVYGHSDLGVNRRRVDAWLAALAARGVS
jgi:uncharacterized protein (DUF1499 family)